MTELEVYGCYATPLDVVFWWDWPPDVRPYLLLARCSAGCHLRQEVMDDREMERLLPEMETLMRLAFQRKHPA